MHARFDSLQRIGRALMLPIAVLPLAGLLLRLGQPDMLDLAFMAAAGNAVFAHLGLLFAVGIAVGLARENNGAAGLAGVVCFLVMTEGAKALLSPPAGIAAGMAADAWRDAAITKLSVPAGIVAGLLSGTIYNRFHAIRLPDYLAFFGGRRFVPIAAGAAGMLAAVALGLGLPTLESGVDGLSRLAIGSGPAGLFIYGALNRLLLITGLHHVINNMAWFVLGDFHGATGDLKRFFAGDPSAGGFMSGFFPVMMFGLPAACLAMYRAAPQERRTEVGGLLLSLALTSALTGVTEPIEFTFLFLAPMLFAFHAMMTGLAMVIMDLLDVKLGFTFSAGLADYAINFRLAHKPLLLLPVGMAYAVIYYAVFSFAIRRFNLATPGRDGETEMDDPIDSAEVRGTAFATALGGTANLIDVDACTTRLRLILADPAAIDEARLKGLGARGILRLGGNAVQVILGPIADMVAGEIRAAMARPNSPTQAPETREAVNSVNASTLEAIVTAFGGSDNVSDRVVRANRVLLEVRSEPDAEQIAAIVDVRAIARVSPTRFHIITGVI